MKYQICTRCVMDTTDPAIRFDEHGVCERCNQFSGDILPGWNHGTGHGPELQALLRKIKANGRGREYDCILGLSGGFDSSYLLHLAVTEFGLRPLVFHVDAGWDTDLAKENICRLTSKLKVDLRTETIDPAEMRDLQLSFFKSGVPHLDTPQDNAFVAVLDNYARTYGIKYVLNGGNISTEVVVNPGAWSYWGTDIAHNKDIARRFGTVPLRSYPFTSVLRRKVIMPYLHGVKVVKPLNHGPYVKKDAEECLRREYGYQAYPQKHFEDTLTKFLEGYWLPGRFGYDVRKPQFSSLILTGQMSRDEALAALERPPLTEEEASALFAEVAEKLGISRD